jgi:hypothetical protein
MATENSKEGCLVGRKSLARIGKVVRHVERHGPRLNIEGMGLLEDGGQDPVKWGTSTSLATVTSASTINLQPIVSYTDATANGDAITAIVAAEQTQSGISVAYGAKLAYTEASDGNGGTKYYLLPIKTLFTGTIPSGSGVYKVLMIIDNGSPGTLDFGYLRGRP